jgi:hypothetical protein
MRLGVTGSKHTIVEAIPWGDGAVTAMTIKRMGLHSHSRLIDGSAKQLLPTLVACEANRYDLIVINGLITFRQVRSAESIGRHRMKLPVNRLTHTRGACAQSVMDMYYSDTLLKRGGYMLLDDLTKAVAPIFWNNPRVRSSYALCTDEQFVDPSDSDRSAPP